MNIRRQHKYSKLEGVENHGMRKNTKFFSKVNSNSLQIVVHCTVYVQRRNLIVRRGNEIAPPHSIPRRRRTTNERGKRRNHLFCHSSSSSSSHVWHAIPRSLFLLLLLLLLGGNQPSSGIAKEKGGGGFKCPSPSHQVPSGRKWFPIIVWENG